MSYSPLLGSSFNRTKLRDPQHVSTFSGMCSMCTADCVGTCEIGISAVHHAILGFFLTSLGRFSQEKVKNRASVKTALPRLVPSLPSSWPCKPSASRPSRTFWLPR